MKQYALSLPDEPENTLNISATGPLDALFKFAKIAGYLDGNGQCSVSIQGDRAVINNRNFIIKYIYTVS